MNRKLLALCLAAVLCLGLLAGCGGQTDTPSPTAEAAPTQAPAPEATPAPAEPAEPAEEGGDETPEEQPDTPAPALELPGPGATVTEDPDSPSGYTVTFVYAPESEDVAAVAVSGPFQYIDPALDLHDENNRFGPEEYVNGMYASNCAPGPFSWGYTMEMAYDENAGVYYVSFPITSGSFAYSYIVTGADGESVTTDDPANPSPAKLNAENSDAATGDLTHSIVYGKYDPEKQSDSPNLDFVRPDAAEQGTVAYVEYTGVLSDHQDLGVFLPAGYDPDRAEPYRVVYASHGGGGNETDWFAMGNVNHIVENLGLDLIVVTMDNNSLGWDFELIEENVLDYIIPFVEENYNVSHSAADRAFCGLSMGSMTTFHMFFDHPNAFAAFGAFSGTDMSAVKEKNGLNKLFFFDVGTCDIASANVMPNGEDQQIKYEDFVAYLEEHPMDNVVDGGYYPGAHDWFVWSASFHDFLNLFTGGSQPAAPAEPDAAPAAPVPGATVTEDPDSPSGYTVTFVYVPESEDVAAVAVSGPFQYIDPALDLHDENNRFGPEEYVNGMYASNCAPGPFSWGYTAEMAYDEEAGVYCVSFPITSGSFAYSYVLTGADGETTTIDDPANPSPAKLNAENSDAATGDLTHSIVYGKYDPEKQSDSPNLDFVRPDSPAGTLNYVTYTGAISDHQDMGIFLPAGYDPDRAEPYPVVYASHGGGGNETDWFAMGNVNHIVENLGRDIIVVTMDNTTFGWDFEQIEANVLNFIIPYMEENYNVSAEAADRAFCGLSMGSMTTFHMFFDHPEAFGAFGAFSGTDLSAVKETEGLDAPVFFFDVGTCDIASANIIPNGEDQQIKYEDFVAYLEENPMDNVVDGGYVPGAHDWFVWSSSFHTFLTDIFQAG